MPVLSIFTRIRILAETRIPSTVDRVGFESTTSVRVKLLMFLLFFAKPAPMYPRKYRAFNKIKEWI